jgi:hypothetical protein
MLTPSDAAELAAVATPAGQADGALLDPRAAVFSDESSEDVDPGGFGFTTPELDTLGVPPARFVAPPPQGRGDDHPCHP